MSRPSLWLLALAIPFSFLACQSDETKESTGAVELPSEVTWHEHIAPLVMEKCEACHREGGIAPFSVDTYATSRKWSKRMNAAIQSGAMPPWGAEETKECHPPGKFKDDLRLSDYEKALFSRWVDLDSPEGDPKKAADLPAPAAVGLVAPSATLRIPNGVTVDGTEDTFKCFVLDPANERDVWVTASQFTEGNSAIVHHALVFTDPDDKANALAKADGDDDGIYDCFGSPGLEKTNLLAAWAPGAVPLRTPETMGIPLRKGHKLVVQIHYHPTGTGPEKDEASSLSLSWTEEEPENVGALFLIGNFGNYDEAVAGGAGFGLLPGDEEPASGTPFYIPAGSEKHVETQRFKIPGAEGFPLRLWAVGTHMHYVGVDMKIAVETNANQCLIQTPHWDFNWQRAYFFEGDIGDLPIVRAGDILNLRCTYNNSVTNPFVRESLAERGLDAPEDVLLGDDTLDEMCLGVFGISVPRAYGSSVGL